MRISIVTMFPEFFDSPLGVGIVGRARDARLVEIQLEVARRIEESPHGAADRRQQTREAIRLIQEDGTCWCGGTEWQGRTAMRISVCSWATTDEDVERSLEARRQAVRRQLDFPSYGGNGLTDEFQGAPWSRIRDEIYREHGA